MSDAVNHPSHYNSHPSGIECITLAERMSFNLGNALKYVWRAGLKSYSTIEDLKKALWYIEREAQRTSRRFDKRLRSLTIRDTVKRVAAAEPDRLVAHAILTIWESDESPTDSGALGNAREHVSRLLQTRLGAAAVAAE